jgi:hypothetical protein
MGEARRIPASEKAPEDFLPPKPQKVEKRVVLLTMTRKIGEVDHITVIMRPGDVLAIDGKTVLEY